MIYRISILILACCYIGVQGLTKTAVCEIASTSGVSTEKIQGKIHFMEKEGTDIKITIKLTGFNSTDNNTYHGFHVHDKGYLGNQCKDAGSHYNPLGKLHGGPNATERHVGDLGNVKEVNGGVETNMTDPVASLFGQHSILNRAIVVHAKADDLGKGGAADSNTTGAAGARLGCCKIVETTSTSDAIMISSSLYLLTTTMFIAANKIFH